MEKLAIGKPDGTFSKGVLVNKNVMRNTTHFFSWFIRYSQASSSLLEIQESGFVKLSSLKFELL